MNTITSSPVSRTPDLARAREYILGRLEAELDSDLFYHNLYHTKDDVLPAVERLAAMEGIGEEERLLLQTAALYHDAGYLKQQLDHETSSAQIAIEILPRFGYTADQIQIVVNLILATRMPQAPNNLLEQIICDADLDVLGSDDFFLRSYDLRAELTAQGKPHTDEEWYRCQLAFLEGHSYFTPSANHLREAAKQRHIAILKRLLTSV
ncbi:MAG: HD domain-containing protein [Chloroflexota bacterium]|nr:HD domain-containing protein [Chloroflexota bacterium]